MDRFEKALLARDWLNTKHHLDRSKTSFKAFLKERQSKQGMRHITEANARHSITQAWKNNDITVELTPSSMEHLKENTDANLENGLREAFGVHSKVVKIPSAAKSNDRHEILGYVAAHDNLKSKIRNGDNIGTGPGRGPFNLIKQIPIIERERLSIISLSGAIFSEDQPSLDADVHAALLATRVNKPLKNLQLVKSNLAPSDNVQQIIENNITAGLESRRLDIAIIGVGTLTSSAHRLSDPEKYPKSLISLSDELSRIVELAQIIENSRSIKELNKKYMVNYKVVGDVCNRLTVIQPPLDVDIELTKYVKEIEKIINQVDACLAVVPENILIDTYTKIICAGGKDKGFPLYQTLKDNETDYTRVYTDSDAALEALKAHDLYKHGKVSKEWLGVA